MLRVKSYDKLLSGYDICMIQVDLVTSRFILISHTQKILLKTPYFKRDRLQEKSGFLSCFVLSCLGLFFWLACDKQKLDKGITFPVSSSLVSSASKTFH